MTRLAGTLADKMLARLVPKSTASACSCYNGPGSTACAINRCCRYGSGCGSVYCHWIINC